MHASSKEMNSPTEFNEYVRATISKILHVNDDTSQSLKDLRLQDPNTIHFLHILVSDLYISYNNILRRGMKDRTFNACADCIASHLICQLREMNIELSGIVLAKLKKNIRNILERFKGEPSLKGIELKYSLCSAATLDLFTGLDETEVEAWKAYAAYSVAKKELEECRHKLNLAIQHHGEACATRKKAIDDYNTQNEKKTWD